MKLVCRSVGLLVLSSCCALAGATPIDFNAHVLDPPPGSFPTTPIVTSTFAVNFTTCTAGELPGQMTADGCFAGVNRTGQDFTTLDITFPDVGPLVGQAATCSSTPYDIFSNARCGLNGIFFLAFSGGVITDGELFFITEDGVVPASSFPTGTAKLGGSTVTPEPAPLLLLGTGLGMLAVVGRRLQTD